MSNKKKGNGSYKETVKKCI